MSVLGGSMRKLHLMVLTVIILFALVASYTSGSVSHTLAQSTAAATSSASSGTSSTVVFTKGQTIKLGWAGDKSLQLIKPSLGIQYGAQIAVNRFNANGGLKGFKVEL